MYQTDKFIIFESECNKIKLDNNLDLISKFKIIKFDYEFNQTIMILKNFDIEEISFGGGDHWSTHPTSYFNYPVDNLPLTIKKLYFYSDSEFNQTVDNLPEGLESLYLGSKFNQPIDNLPNSLKFLSINSTNTLNFENLPNNVNEIVLGDKAINIELKYIPEFVKKITLYDNNKNLSDLEKYRDNLEIDIKDYQKLKNFFDILSGM